MNLPKAYISGFQKSVKSPRMLFLLYFSNILMALILALPFMSFLKNSMGSSRLLENALEGFDFTVFSNLTFYNADGISVIIGNIKWLLIAFFLLSVFLTGGIINILNKDKFSTSQFFSGAAYNFFRFLGLNLIVLFFQIIFALIVYIPMGIILDGVGQGDYTELNYYYIVIISFVIHMLIFLLISMIGDYAKFHLVLKDRFNIFKGFWKGVRYVFKNFLKTYFLYLFLLFIPAVIMYVYLYFSKDIKMATGIGILIVFAMQQGFIFLRSFLRVWILASEFNLYADDYAHSNIDQDIVFSVVNTKISEEEKVIKEEKKSAKKKEKTVTVADKNTEKSEYAIDFSKTFTDDNDEVEGKVLTEEEILKRLEKEAEENQEEIIEEEVNQIVEENIENEVLIGDNDFEDEDEDDEHHEMIEHVQQNVIDTEDSEEETEQINKKQKDKKNDDDMIEFEL